MREEADRVEALPPTRPLDSRAGSQLGKYLLERRLGSGGMGVVYLARDTLLNRAVAVKLLPEGLAADPTALRRFLREAQALARLNHPHVVTVYEVDQQEGVYYLVMERVEGGSVQDLLNERGALPWREATQLAADACRGLAAVHAADLVHRDVKPGNLLRAGTAVKLADFGLAWETDPAAPATRQRHSGTPHYMSPEQCRGEELDGRSDLYALGATYFALLTAAPPFRAADPVALMFAHCSRPAPDPRSLNPSVPGGCADVVQRALAKYPTDRFADADALRAALEALLSTVEVPPQPEAAPLPQEPPTRSTRRPRRRLGIVLAAAGLALAAGLSVLALSGGKQASATDTPTGSRSGSQPTTEQENTTPLVVASAWKTIETGREVRGVAFHPTAPDRLAWGNVAGRAWAGDVAGTELFEHQQAGNVCAVGFTFGGKRVWVGYRSGDLVVRGLAEHKVVNEKRPGEMGGPIREMAFSRDGSRTAVLAGNSSRPTINVFQDEERRDLAGSDLRASTLNALVLALSDDGALLATGYARDRGQPPRCLVKLWDSASGAWKQDLETSFLLVRSLAFSSGGLLAAADSHHIELWDLDQGVCLRTLKGNTIKRMAFSPDGRTLAWCDVEGVRLWGVAAIRELAVLASPEERMECVAFSADGRLLAAGGANGTVRLWRVDEVLERVRTRPGGDR